MGTLKSIRITFDTLAVNAPIRYRLNAYKAANGRCEMPFDPTALELWREAAYAQYKHDAKKFNSLRRVYTQAYLSRSEDGQKIFLNDFKDIGARNVILATKNESEWYTDGHQDGVLSGVVILIGRHCMSGTKLHDETTVGAGLYMAGTKHSDWDGVTLYTKLFNTFEEAARYADACAEGEAAVCREADEQDRREEKREELRHDIKDARRACLTLLRDMRPLRRQAEGFPGSVCAAVQDQVRAYLARIRACRTKLEGL